MDSLFLTKTCMSCGKETYGPVYKDALGTHMLCTHCDASFNVNVPTAPQSEIVNAAVVNPETAFDRNRVDNKPQKAVFIEWYNLAYLFTDLLTDLLGRQIKADSAREEYYWWKVSLEEPITPAELESLFELAQANDYDREENAYTDGFPIMELCQGVCNKLMSKLLSFSLVSTRADDDGVWFIGDNEGQSQSVTEYQFDNEPAPVEHDATASSAKEKAHQNELIKVLPDGSALVVRTGGDPMFSGVYVYFKQPDGGENDDLLCVAEFNSDRIEGKQICICAYAHNLEEPTYYASYHDDGKPCGVV